MLIRPVDYQAIDQKILGEDFPDLGLIYRPYFSKMLLELSTNDYLSRWPTLAILEGFEPGRSKEILACTSRVLEVVRQLERSYSQKEKFIYQPHISDDMNPQINLSGCKKKYEAAGFNSRLRHLAEKRFVFFMRLPNRPANQR